MGKRPTHSPKPGKPSSSQLVQVPAQNIEILREGLGLDISQENPEALQGVLRVFGLRQSISSSPYTSAEMLEDYVNRGFPDLPGKVISAIDQQVAHRQKLETIVTQGSEQRKGRAQIGAQVIGGLGIVAALVAAYFHVSAWVCSICIVVSIGGPNAASIMGRILDRGDKFGR